MTVRMRGKVKKITMVELIIELPDGVVKQGEDVQEFAHRALGFYDPDGKSPVSLVGVTFTEEQRSETGWEPVCKPWPEQMTRTKDTRR